MNVTGRSQTSCWVIADTEGCEVQVIPTEHIFSALFWEAKDVQKALLFYSTICRHYAAKLKKIHLRFFLFFCFVFFLVLIFYFFIFFFIF